jgi:hypothetical protein
MNEKRIGAIKLRHLYVTNFKALDELNIEFPPPRMTNDPDILVMGSKNGLGKTSVLESCALLFLAATAGEEILDIGRYSEMPINLPDLLIRAGSKEANIEGIFTIDNEEYNINLILMRDGRIKIKGKLESFRGLNKIRSSQPIELVQRFLLSLIGFSTEPMINPPFLYFHSYRKVQEGNPELGMMTEGGRMFLRRSRFRPNDLQVSTFKLQILRSMMGRANLFESVEDKHSGEVFT